MAPTDISQLNLYKHDRVSKKKKKKKLEACFFVLFLFFLVTRELVGPHSVRLTAQCDAHRATALCSSLCRSFSVHCVTLHY